MHNGRVEAFSKGPGAGSELVLHLPLTASPPIAGATEEDQGKAAQPSIGISNPISRILIVDDNADAAESLSLLLRHAGHEVQLVFDGVAAREIASVFRSFGPKSLF